MIKKWYDDKGLAWVMQVSDTAPEGVLGLFLGPPDLSSLHLTLDKEKLLREKLIDHKLYYAPLLMGQRPLLFEILHDTGLPESLIRDLVTLYQIDYYGE